MSRLSFVFLSLCYIYVASSTSLPHIVFIAVDDWGWADFSLHSYNESNKAEIITPVMGSLAAAGIVLDRHYVFRFCSPSRSALHTGRNPIHINVLNSPLASVNLADPVSGFAGLPRNVTALPEKLAGAGYSTVQAGKWHLGLATPDHTPKGRGYQQSLSYLDGANDYWTYGTGDWCGDGSWTDLWASAQPAYGKNNSWACSQEYQPSSCVYEDDMFTEFAVGAIEKHDPSTPLFLYFAPHNVHLPLEVPQAQLDRFSFINGSLPRQAYAAMVNEVDTHIGAVVDALKKKGMWNTTVLVLSADNGGPIFGPSSACTVCDGTAGANNYPLRGGKHSNWEGGIRANAFVSGGFVPVSERGTTKVGFTAIEDWYRTFCALAGVDPTDEKAAAAGLPPVEGYDLWPYLSGDNATSPREEIWIGGDSPIWGQPNQAFVQGLIRADGWKLLQDNLTMNIWTGPKYPNASTPVNGGWNNTPYYCGSPSAPSCLFNVFQDPTEHQNLAAEQPAILAEMTARMAALAATVFSPNRGNPSTLACNASENVWGGFVGPFLP